jgi:outer membrane biosynthesis protein TonB
MRRAAALALTVGLAAIGAHAQPARQPALPAARLPATAPARVDLTDPVLAFYPPAARAAGVQGQAVIRCKRDQHLALAGCMLVSEDPAGQGFGAAALALAAKSPPNPKLQLKDAADLPPEDAVVRFQLAPPYISPDLSRMAHVVKSPEIVAKPTGAQIQAAYPTRALDNQIQGGAVIECMATVAGKLAECHVYNETPTGYGFGQAALDLAGDFALKPRLVDGAPVDGPVRIAVSFVPGDPTAPLSLGSGPGGANAGEGTPPR